MFLWKICCSTFNTSTSLTHVSKKKIIVVIDYYFFSNLSLLNVNSVPGNDSQRDFLGRYFDLTAGGTGVWIMKLMRPEVPWVGTRHGVWETDATLSQFTQKLQQNKPVLIFQGTHLSKMTGNFFRRFKGCKLFWITHPQCDV